MTLDEKKHMAEQTYQLGIDMAKTFTDKTSDKDYMILAIMACISGLTNSTYSTMPMINYDGDLFKSMRIEKGYTLRQTEDATGISNSYLSQLENGKITKPSQQVVNKLLNWYNNGISISKSDHLATLQQS